MNDCSLLRDDLKAYLDGELPYLRRWAVRRHLSSCESCRQEAQAIENIGKQLRNVPMEEFPAALRSRILANLPDAPTAPALARPTASPRWRPQPMVTWGAAAALILAGLLIYPYFSPSPQMRQAAQSPMEKMAGGALSDDTMLPGERKETEQLPEETRSYESAPAAPAPSGNKTQSRAAAPALSPPPSPIRKERSGSPTSGKRSLPEAERQERNSAQPPTNAGPSRAKPSAPQRETDRRDFLKEELSPSTGGSPSNTARRTADNTPQIKEKVSPDTNTNMAPLPAGPGAAQDTAAGRPAPARSRGDVPVPGMAGRYGGGAGSGGGLGSAPGALGGRVNPGENSTLRTETKTESLDRQSFFYSLQKGRLPEVVMEVDNVTEKSLELKRIVLKLGGSIVENNALLYAASPNGAAYSLQIPSDRFQEALSQISVLGELQLLQSHSMGINRATQEVEQMRQRKEESDNRGSVIGRGASQPPPPANIIRRLVREISRNADNYAKERRSDSPVSLNLQMREKPRP
jgi:anti-sigma factor RsiW